MQTITTARLLLRAWSTSTEDLARLKNLYAQPELQRWLGEPPAGGPIGLVHRWADLCRAEPRAGFWAIGRLDGSPVAGTVLLKPMPDAPSDLEVGWHVHPDSWGLGYATEAAAAVLYQAFDNGLDEVYATVKPGNERSIAVCNRLRMTPLGRTTRWGGVECEAFTLRASQRSSLADVELAQRVVEVRDV